jgi:hypothetical protein
MVQAETARASAGSLMDMRSLAIASAYNFQRDDAAQARIFGLVDLPMPPAELINTL